MKDGPGPGPLTAKNSAGTTDGKTESLSKKNAGSITIAETLPLSAYEKDTERENETTGDNRVEAAATDDNESTSYWT